jgi:uncharacterized protein YuzB (UPF0349 family)
MPNEFRVCDECRMTNIKSLLPKLKKMDPDAQVEIGCQSYCGIGYKKPFCIVNGKHITALSEDELIQKVQKAVERERKKQSVST